MKRIIALVLAMTCVIGLFAACGNQTNPTTTPGTNNTVPGTTVPGTTATTPVTDPTTAPTEPATQPTEPATEPTTPPTEPSVDVPTLPGAPANGECVYMYMSSNGLAVGYNAEGSKLAGVAATVTDGVLTGEGAAVFQVSIDENGYYTFTTGGKYLTSGETGNSLTLEYDPSEYSVWELAVADGGFYIINVGAVYNGNHQYLEYYKGFTTYGFSASNAGIYTFQFFVTNDAQPVFPPKPTMPEFGSTLTIAELLNLPLNNDELTAGRFYVRATIQSISNATYGQMIIFDETGSISVYGSYSADGVDRYSALADKPVKGDEVLLYVNVKCFNGTFEINSAWIQEIKHNTFDDSAYVDMTIEEARNAAADSLVKLTGVVAQITYATGFVPSGFILVDGTSSIYVYDRVAAGVVSVGNTVTIAATKTYWILDTEVANANKYGYAGCNQVADVWLLSNDGGNTAFDSSWVTETTIKEIMDTPVSIDITTKIFKVTALITRADGTGFTNFYLNDLDGTTGSYVYTQCNGNDLDWMNAYNGKICTVYMVVINAKSTPSGCAWRFLPIIIKDENFDTASVNVGEFIVKYFGVGQFKTEYTSDPALELVTTVDSALLNFAGAALTYSSDNTDVVYFENGIMHCGAVGTANVTVTGTYNGQSYSETVTITVKEAEKIDYIDVNTAIQTTPGTSDAPVVVTVKGIVGPSLVNQVGFYLFDGTGIIAVKCSADVMATLEIGQEVIIRGNRDNQTKGGDTYFGQTCIREAEVVVNYYGSHEMDFSAFAQEFTGSEFYNLDILVDYSTSVYVVKAKYSASGYNVQLTAADGTTISLYCSGSGQYSWLAGFAGQELTFEITACNWNDKKFWKACVLSVTLEDGTKIYNSLNFDNN